jgi:hypothetical protein
MVPNHLSLTDYLVDSKGIVAILHPRANLAVACLSKMDGIPHQ